MYGAMLRKGEKYYTYFSKIFAAIHDAQKQYNWLITNCECYPHTQRIYDLLQNDYCWLSGDELTALVEEEDFQWIWAVLTGFKKDIPLSQVLEYPLPDAGFRGYWTNPISMQHLLASVELVAFDSSFTLAISKNEQLVQDFKTAFPLSEDLEQYNTR